MEEKQSILKNKKLLIIIPVLVIIVAVVGVTYAFFNYTRTGGENSLGTGRIYFNTTESRTVALTDVFPVSSQNLDTSTLSSISVGIVGDTTYPGGEEYQVTLVDVNNTINNKTVPIHYIATYTETSGKTIGDESNSYFSDRGSTSNVYSLTEEGLVTEGKQVLVGYLTEGVTGIDGVLTIKAWISIDDVVITDTYDGTETDNMGTTTEWVRGRTVINTTEWNGFTGNGALSFKVKTEANEGVWVPEPPVQYAQGIKCQRVTSTAKLHTETCTQSSKYCYADGYTANGSKGTTTITYGNTSVTSGELHTGDAFDCDVNKDGIVNVDGNGNSTERFYYVSPYYDTNANPPAFDNTTATLIYYSNTYNNGSSVVASTNGTKYYSSNENWHGPVTAATHLPTTQEWSNITLKNTSRTILACNNANCSNIPVLTTDNGNQTIENPFSYTGKAARLLTLMELANGCKGTINNNTSVADIGSLAACNFLFEGTKYADNNNAITGPWLETPHASYSDYVWFARANNSYVSLYLAYNSNNGARPAIDVLISDISY